VQANYKETQLAHIRAGDPAEIRVDAIPGVIFRGKVDQVSPASGSQFALLPPDNATGKFHKGRAAGAREDCAGCRPTKPSAAARTIRDRHYSHERHRPVKEMPR
jgi:hypothetical protein